MKLRYFGFRGNAQFVCLRKHKAFGPKNQLLRNFKKRELAFGSDDCSYFAVHNGSCLPGNGRVNGRLAAPRLNYKLLKRPRMGATILLEHKVFVAIIFYGVAISVE